MLRLASPAGVGIALALAALLCSSSVASAQEPRDRPEIYATASAGKLWTSDRLYGWNVVTDPADRPAGGDWGVVSLNTAPDAGIGVTARLPGLGMDISVAAQRTIGLEGTLVTGTYCTGICLAVLPLSHEHTFDAGLTRLSVSFDLRTVPSIWRVQPFITVGGGLKLYRFDSGAIPDAVTVPAPEDVDVGTYRIGAGVSAPIDRMEIVARVTEYLSGYPSRTGTLSTELQHDWSATLSLRYRIW